MGNTVSFAAYALSTATEANTQAQSLGMQAMALDAGRELDALGIRNDWHERSEA